MPIYSPALLGTHYTYLQRDGSGGVDLGAWFCAQVIYLS